ncbi:Protein PET100, mitochondrial [Lachnellula willkommii]|uniref:Protein PET100, mitochondrial n=1 Tax=Lachnellula willkommii TaxID=215461 RepID=A0A559M8K9_9HELO|nr:Protein PET100, mitochondrial [Lachnellula willkommii]
MGGPNLEVFKFGMYIMFPIATMYYYGTNLDKRFSVPDFWPKPEQTNRIPFEKEEIHSELDRLKQRRLYLREKRLQNGGDEGKNEGQDS